MSFKAHSRKQFCLHSWFWGRAGEKCQDRGITGKETSSLGSCWRQEPGLEAASCWLNHSASGQSQEQCQPAPPTSPKIRVSTGVPVIARGAAWGVLISTAAMKTSTWVLPLFSALWCSSSLLGSCSVQAPWWSSPPCVQILLINQYGWGLSEVLPLSLLKQQLNLHH